MIPKKFCAKNIKDFCPISLVGCVYKFMSKVLTNRLSKVINLIIGERQITDAIFIANEEVDDVFKNKKKWSLLQIGYGEGL